MYETLPIFAEACNSLFNYLIRNKNTVMPRCVFDTKINRDRYPEQIDAQQLEKGIECCIKKYTLGIQIMV